MPYANVDSQDMTDRHEDSWEDSDMDFVPCGRIITDPRIVLEGNEPWQMQCA